MHGLGNNSLDLLAGGVVREGGGVCDALVSDHAELVGDGVQRKRSVAHGGVGVGFAVVLA